MNDERLVASSNAPIVVEVSMVEVQNLFGSFQIELLGREFVTLLKYFEMWNLFRNAKQVWIKTNIKNLLKYTDLF